MLLGLSLLLAVLGQVQVLAKSNETLRHESPVADVGPQVSRGHGNGTQALKPKPSLPLCCR